MEIRYLEGFTLAGFTVRTSNFAEQAPSTAKITGLWQNFYQHTAPNLSPDSCVYGVYSNYESDVNGHYDLTLATTCMLSKKVENTREVAVASGKYLVFAAKGEMPDSVIGLWGQIWSYFSDEDCPHKRTYISDYERYLDEQSVEICIAIC